MMPDDRDDVPGEGEGEVPVITGEMSEEAITAAALINDSDFMARLDTLYDHFVGIGTKAVSSAAYGDAMNAFGNAMQIANSMHNIALVRESIVRKRLDRHATRTDLDLDDDDPANDLFGGDAVDDL